MTISIGRVMTLFLGTLCVRPVRSKLYRKIQGMSGKVIVP